VVALTNRNYPGRTRACNPRLHRLILYALGHGGCWVRLPATFRGVYDGYNLMAPAKIWHLHVAMYCCRLCERAIILTQTKFHVSAHPAILDLYLQSPQIFWTWRTAQMAAICFSAVMHASVCRCYCVGQSQRRLCCAGSNLFGLVA